MMLPPEWENEDKDDRSWIPWGEIPWGSVILFVVVFIIGALMEAFDWYPWL